MNEWIALIYVASMGYILGGASYSHGRQQIGFEYTAITASVQMPSVYYSQG